MAGHRDLEDPATEPWHRAESAIGYQPRRAWHPSNDDASIARLHRDSFNAQLAMKVLAKATGPGAKLLYAELLRGGALHPQPVRSIPAAELITQAVPWLRQLRATHGLLVQATRRVWRAAS